MKKGIIIVMVFLTVVVFSVNAQRPERHKDDYKKGITLGKYMPDIPLGKVTNNKTGKTRFSDFKGKLVILDFWSSNCPTCIDAFPKMEVYQRKYGKRIQVFLVNPFETQAEIDAIFSRSYMKGRHLPDLPSIVEAKKLLELFPLANFTVPMHVWIDPTGKIIVRGSHLNTNMKNIEDVINGKPLKFSKNDANNSRQFKTGEPMYIALNDRGSPGLDVGSYFTKYNNVYYTYPGAEALNIIDSAKGIARTSVVNRSIVELYYLVFKDVFQKEENKNILFSKYNYGYTWKRHIDLKVKDTLSYSSDMLQIGYSQNRELQEWDAEGYVKSRFCYEQILPLTIPEKDRKQRMLEDLNLYFGAIYAARGSLVEREVPCYLLVKSGQASKSYEDKNKDGLMLSEYFEGLFSLDFTEYSLPIIDGTGILGKVKLQIPDRSIKNIDELKQVLAPYGLALVKTSRKLTRLLIEETAIAK
jgi:thiol-disulfide isomerase/thioredoxin